MDTEKIINERLQKIALKNQKVDLSLVADIDALFRDVHKNEQQIENLSKELRSISVKTAVKIEKMLALRKQFEAKAKELGVDPDTILATGMFSFSNNLMKKIDKIKNL